MAKKRTKNSNHRWDHLPIAFLVYETEDVIVFLDDALEVDWETSEKYDRENRFPDGWTGLQNRYAALESSLVDGVSKGTRKQAVRMLAESVARGINGDVAAGHKILDDADRFVTARNREVGRLRYLYAAIWAAAPIALFALLAWLLRSSLKPLLGATVFSLILCGAAGAMGAMFLVLRNAIAVLPDPQADGRLHRAEAAARILAGGFGAVLAALAVKAGILFPQLNTIPGGSYVLFLASIVAGASERLVPDLIQKLETPDKGGTPKLPNAHG